VQNGEISQGVLMKSLLNSRREWLSQPAMMTVAEIPNSTPKSKISCETFHRFLLRVPIPM
jgi:hypothetical protein